MDGHNRECFLELNDDCEQVVSSSEDEASNEDLPMDGDFPMAFDFSKDYATDAPKPKLGMVFKSDSEAYEFYNHYAKSVGFSVRKTSTTLRANKTISRRILCCSKEGFRRTHPRGPSLKARPPTRVDCKARLVTRLQADGTYCVIEFVKEHNHELKPLLEAHILKMQQNNQVSQAEVDNMHSAGTVPNNSDSYMAGEVGGLPSLNSTHVDCTDCSQRRPNEVLEKGDAHFLLQYLQQMQKENPYFIYSIRMSENNQLGCCFWCDAKSVIDYNFFGDVVCFDTTYKTNDFEKPYAPFIGVNNHGKLILFGCALLLDETTESLTWLFQTFLNVMNGKQPKTIFTDQTVPIVDASRHVFPHTHHRFSTWHIYQDAIKHVTYAFEKSASFAKDFKSCIFDSETEEEFQSSWDTLLGRYNLAENRWLQDLYQMREKWVQAYGRDHFCAGMTTIQRCEGMNKFLKKYLKRFLPLREFVTQYEKAIGSQREKENRQDSISRETKPDLRTMWPAEARAAERYTRKIFMLFQDEYVGTLDLFVEVAGEDGPLYTYTVSSFERNRPRTVTFDPSSSAINCSCKRFEFTGILCAHALKVLHNRRLLDLPAQYYLNRWTKDAKVGGLVNRGGKPSQVNAPGYASFETRHIELTHLALTLAARAATTEKSSAFAKLILTRVLGEVDNLLKTESGSVNAANHENVDKQSAHVKGVSEKAKGKRKSQPMLKGSRVSVCVDGTVSRAPLATGTAGLPLYPAPRYTQEGLL